MDNNLTRAQDLAVKILGNKLEVGKSNNNDSVQQQKQAVLVRLETVFTNISDNVYNLGGFFNAQLTSMEETRTALKEKYAKEKTLLEESLIEKRTQSTQSSKDIQQKIDSQISPLDDLLKSFQSILDAASSGYDLLDFDRKKRNQRKTTRKNSKAKIKTKVGPVLDIGRKFLGKLPLIGAVITVGEGIYKTLEEDEEETEKKGGPLASFVYNTADSLIENVTFGLVNMKKVEETAKVLTGSEEGKKIADKNRQEIQGQPSSELEFMAPAVSEQAPAPAPAPPSLMKKVEETAKVLTGS
ncbi:MAG: hypothetical protein EBR82_60350, partial [Caulobacteraceae bacterium]|nr:hypothetical protein [Caulobacteraceae bacterium]